LGSATHQRNGSCDADYIETFERDDEGRLLLQDNDSDGDGTVDFHEAYSYDENGYVSWHEYYDDPPSVPYSCDYFTNDINGNVLIEDHDYGCDESTDNTYTYEYTFDEDNNVLVQERDDGQGETTKLVYTYDEEGNMLTEEYWNSYDEPAYRDTYTYDENANKLSREEDMGADGTIERMTTWTYDALDDMLTEEIDEGGDGIAEITTTNTYDSYGNQLTQDVDELYEDPQMGIIDYHQIYLYDCWS
jgi:serralysin